MSSQVWSDVDGPVRSTPILCPALQVHMVADAVPKPVRITIRVQVIALDVLLDKLHTLGTEAAVITCSAPANEKIRMRLATIISSIEQVWIGQAKGVDVGHQLCTVRCWHVVSLCQMSRHPDTAWLQRILASAADQSRFGVVHDEPKLLQLPCDIVVAHEAPCMTAL
jgi:hypothetical protein